LPRQINLYDWARKYKTAVSGWTLTSFHPESSHEYCGKGLQP
jgi:hypothetical protein